MEEKNSHLLLTPSAKKKSGFEREYPFPIVTNECEENESDLNWKIAEGHLQENCVLVHDEKCMKMLYNMGYFGKGTLSKNAPQVCSKKYTSETMKKQSMSQERASMKDCSEDIIIDVVDSDNEKENADNDIEVLISSDGDDCVKIEYSDQSILCESESLQLTFEEAFFLSYGLGCLIVKDKNQPLNLASLWSRLCELSSRDRFPVMYTAYHHFRSKGWIVKSGLKFGADYVLYKDGPPFYHATYSVVVRPVKENLRELFGYREFTWSSLAALNRINNTAGKGLLFLYVIKPNSLMENKDCTPSCISQFKLEEVLFKRWVAAENREESEP